MAEPEAEIKCIRCQELNLKRPHPVWPKDPEAKLCLYHSQREDKAGEFKEAIDAMIAAGDCKFRGFVFPPVFIFNGLLLKNADFKQATFQRFAFFTAATFEGNADFIETSFQGRADFAGAKFQGDADFRGAIFPEQGSAFFWKATFQRTADFGEAEFHGAADFREVRFGEQGVTSFGQATFKGYADFRKTTFQGYATFHETRFEGNANFTFATFSGETEFSLARFKEMVDFRGGTLRDNSQEKEYELFSKVLETRFLRVSFERPELVCFYRVNLSRCRFLDTDLKKVNFVGVTWPKQRWRDIIYDEIHPDSRHRYPELEELYRQLKQNYEQRRDWGQAASSITVR